MDTRRRRQTIKGIESSCRRCSSLRNCIQHILRLGVPYCSVLLRGEIPSQGDGPRGCREQPVLPVGSGWSEEKRKGGGWASREPTHPCPSKNKFANESCLLRRRGQPLLCWRSPRFREPFVGGASTRPRRHCSEIACLLPGSTCLVHALLSVNASWAEPIPRSALLEWRGASRRDCPGDLYRTPPSCCLNRLRRGVPSGLAERCEGPNILPASPGS